MNAKRKGTSAEHRATRREPVSEVRQEEAERLFSSVDHYFATMARRSAQQQNQRLPRRGMGR